MDIVYQKNNILFRIASAASLSKFKSTQSHTLLQLVRKELKFDLAARETVLVEYDHFSQWVGRLEKKFLRYGEGRITLGMLSETIESAREQLSNIQEVMQTNSEVFSGDVIEYAKLIHSYSMPILKKKILSCNGLNVTDSFTNIVDIFILYLQHILIAMHEFNNNMCGSPEVAFVGISDFCVDQEAGDVASMMRINFFINAGVAPKFTVKNYGAADYFDSLSLSAPADLHLIKEDTDVYSSS